MNVDLPSTGCNIINSATSFYNYSSDGRTRETYVIYEGKALLQSTATSQYGYSYTGDCLDTGDLVYKPELVVYYPIAAFCLISFITIIIYRIFIKRLMP